MGDLIPIDIRERIASGDLPEGWTSNDKGHVFNADGNRVGKDGRELKGAAGAPMSEETKQKLREARLAAKENGGTGGNPKKPTRKEAFERAMDRLEPKALKVLEAILDDDKATAKDKLSAALNVFAYQKGKPTQRIEQETVERIIYELAEHEPAPKQASGE